MDISFKTAEGRFNYRVCGIIVHDGKLLAMKDNGIGHYYLPGGRVHMHETTDAAVLREMREELEIDAKIVRPLWLNQSFFTLDGTEERFHEVCLYYLVDVSETDLLARGESFTREEGSDVHTFRWLPFEQLRDEYLYPLFIKEQIFHLPEQLTLMAEFE
ncbi:MAG: NUDIX domain-containing protein [Clostridia bacterium]|nr:NUDIX domain-containing protein [Clostridia bacterium]